jgi:pilus assembly protein Flp/PilA
MFLTKLNTGAKRLIKNKDGASAIEYAIIVAMVALVLFSMVTPMGSAIRAQYDKIVVAMGGTATTAPPAANP